MNTTHALDLIVFMHQAIYTFAVTVTHWSMIALLIIENQVDLYYYH